MKPFVTFEKRVYKVFDSAHYISRKNKKLMEQSYKSAVIKDLSSFDIVLNDKLQSLLLESVEELSKLDGFIKDKLKYFPMIILRSEALSSTQIEYYDSSYRNIASAQILETKDREANIIKNNLESLVFILENDIVISKEIIVKLNQIVLGDDNADIRNIVNWIGSPSSIPQNAIYVPPHPSHLKENIDEFIKFCKRDDIHPLIQASFAHAYFETIHPFADGNGRVGRILIQLLLKEKGYLENLFLPFSIGLLKDKDKYIKSLDNFKEGNYEAIIEVMLESVLLVTPSIYEALNKLIKIKEEWIGRIVARSDALVWEILDELIYQPVISINYIKEKFNANDQAVRNNFELLEKYLIIKKIGDNKRNVLYEAIEIINVLENIII